MSQNTSLVVFGSSSASAAVVVYVFFLFFFLDCFFLCEWYAAKDRTLTVITIGTNFQYPWIYYTEKAAIVTRDAAIPATYSGYNSCPIIIVAAGYFIYRWYKARTSWT